MIAILFLFLSTGLVETAQLDKSKKILSYSQGAIPGDSTTLSSENDALESLTQGNLPTESPSEETTEFPTEQKVSKSKKKSEEKQTNKSDPSEKDIVKQSDKSDFSKKMIVSPVTKGTYLILAPKVIRPGRPYLITISVQNVKNPMSVYLVIQRDGNNTLRQTVEVTEGKPFKATFEIPKDFKDGDYKLIAFGQDINKNYVVLNQTELEYQPKIANVFLQTDKPAYKRGQLVRFRVIITDPDLRPYKEQVSIYITCPTNLRIVQWEHVKETSGVFSNEFQLPNEVLIGTYQITVEIEDEVVKEPLLIVEDDGVLPKFEVIVKCENYVLNDKQATIHVEVIAKYPVNKLINGSLELILQEADNENPNQLKQIGKIVDGKGVVEIPIKAIDFSRFNEEKKYDIIANVTDFLTSTYHIGSKSVLIFRDKYRIDIVPSSLSFKPGLKFQAWVKLELFNGDFLPDGDIQVNVSYGFSSYEDSTWKKKIYSVPSIGLVELNIYPTEESRVIYIKADYQGYKKELKISKKIQSSSQKFIQLTSESPQYKAGDKAIFFVNTTDPIPMIYMVMLARNNIVTTGVIKVKKQNNFKFQLSVTEAMIPSTLVVIYYITDEGQVLADSLNLTVGGPFSNNVSISFYQENGNAIDPENEVLSPGSRVLISGMTAPKSHVFISVTDEGAYLLKPDDLFTHNKLYKVLGEYERFQKQLYHRDSNIMDACSLLQESGFAVLTNGCDLQEGNPVIDYNSKNEVHSKLPEFSTTEIKGDLSVKYPTKSKVKVRRNFPETWLWIDIEASSDGKFETTSVLPDTATTWIASAFAMDSDSGLGLMAYPAKVRVSKQFIVILSIPFSAKRNQDLKVDALVFHDSDVAIDVTVTLMKSNFYEMPNTTDNETYSHKILLEPNSYGKVSFHIIPKVIGIIPILVSAISSAGRDAEERKIIIHPEGITQTINETLFMRFGKKGKIAHKCDVKVKREDTIPSSDKALIVIQGNGFGIPLKHVEKAIVKNEDLFRRFSRNIAVFHYLDITSQFPSDYHITNHLAQLEREYEELQDLQTTDGAFVYSGSKNAVLTAFAIRYITQLQAYVHIDENLLTLAKNWLSSKQSKDGSFGSETTSSFPDYLMDITSEDFFITTDILLSLLKAGYPLESQEVAGAASYLEKFVNQSESISVESLAKLAYVLNLAKSLVAQDVFQKLELKFNVDNPTFDASSGVNVLAVSYLIMNLIDRGEIGKANLFSQTLSSNFVVTSVSSWETTRSLEAMTLVAEYTYNPETEADIKIDAGRKFIQNLKIDNANVNIAHLIVVPDIANKDIKIRAIGKGAFQVSIKWMYNIPEPLNATQSNELYSLSINPSLDNDLLTLTICFKSVEIPVDVINVEFPLGYQPHEVSGLVDNVFIIATETYDHNAFIFLTKNSNQNNCLDVKAIYTNGDRNFKDIPVTLFYYEDPETYQFTRLYSSPE